MILLRMVSVFLFFQVQKARKDLQAFQDHQVTLVHQAMVAFQVTKEILGTHLLGLQENLDQRYKGSGKIFLLGKAFDYRNRTTTCKQELQSLQK